MAAEEKKEINDVEETKGRKSSIFKVLILILVFLVLLIALALGGFIAWTKYVAPIIGKGQHGGPDVKEKVVIADTSLGPMLPLDPFIVNLSEPAGKRFIKVTMEFELSSRELENEVKNKLPQFKDHIITVLSSKSLEDVITAEGKFKLKEEIMSRVNQNLKTGVIRNVFFTEFVVQ